MASATKTTQAVTAVPYRLTFTDEPDASGGYGTEPARSGRMSAGWTVGHFTDARAAARFVQAHPTAAMPCWRRFDVVDGELRSVR